MEFAQAGSGAEGTHVEHDIPTCGLQHMVSWKQTDGNCIWLRFSLSKIYSTTENLLWSGVNLDVMV